MRPTLSLAFTVLVALLAFGAAWAAGPAPVVPAAPAPVKRRSVDRREAINRVEKDCGALLAAAKLDAAAALVGMYKSYTPDQLSSPAFRDVDIDKLLKVVEDESVKNEFREMAANAIIWDKAQRHDSQLDTVTNKGIKRPRAAFSRRVLPLLTDKSEFTRALALIILQGPLSLWPGVRDPDITTATARNIASCRQARAAFDKVLQK
jgi:hypothetical protein